MDAKLKAELTEAMNAALDRFEKANTKKRGRSTKTQKQDVPRSATAPIVAFRFARTKLNKLGLWKKLQDDIVRERLIAFATSLDNARKRRAADAAQLSFEGFEHLPKRIRIGGTDGNQRVQLYQSTLAQFLEFKAEFEKRTGERTAREKLMMGELEKLAATVERFKGEPQLTVAAALARAQEQPIAIGAGGRS